MPPFKRTLTREGARFNYITMLVFIPADGARCIATTREMRTRLISPSATLSARVLVPHYQRGVEAAETYFTSATPSK